MGMMRTPLRDRARGRWNGILAQIGINQNYLTGRNGPCPLCPGGRDRWRFLDTEKNGTWLCTHCGAGAGIDLVMRFTGLPFKEAAERVEAVIGKAPVEVRQERDVTRTRASLNAMWRQARPVACGDVTDRYLRNRGIGMDRYPDALRTVASLRYCDNNQVMSHWPAMLAMVTAPDGKPCTLHRTYLTRDGSKAPVDVPRKLYSAVAPGAAVRLADVGVVLGIAEGIETALAATRLFGVPTWAAICAGMLERFEPPNDIKKLIIFGDHDVNGVGQRAGYALAARLAGRIEIEVKIPEKPDSDWNDVIGSD